MEHPLESLLTTYFSQQEEMGIPVTILQDKSQGEPKTTAPEVKLSLPTEPTPQAAPVHVEKTPVQEQVQPVVQEQPAPVKPVIPKPTPVVESIPTPPPAQVQPSPVTSAPVFNHNSTRDRETIRKELADLYYRSKECTACTLCQSRNTVVFGSGNATADILIVGEAPGFEEDQQGRPFVGPAGQLLTKMLKAINLERDKDTFICNVLKCRPPGNRTPSTQESLTCLPILKRQIAIIRPKIILLLGKTAATTVLDRPDSINRLRGHEFSYHGIPAFVTYHPAALLRNSALKHPTWEDLQKFQQRYRELING